MAHVLINPNFEEENFDHVGPTYLPTYQPTTTSLKETQYMYTVPDSTYVVSEDMRLFGT